MRVPSSAREEISRTLPFIPAGADGVLPVSSQNFTDRRQLVEETLATLRRRADEGNKSAAAVLAIAGYDPEAALEACGRIQSVAAVPLTGEPDAIGAEASIGGLYGEAVEADSESREDDAALLLAILAATDAGAHDGMLGLAVLALRRNCIDEADALVAACLLAEPIHPRAGSVFAICELERGRSASGQAYLAAACRHARRLRHFRKELHLAQRALLLMHLS